MLLQPIATKETLVYVVVADQLTGRIEQSVGTPEAVKQRYLVDELVGNESVLARLASSLNGQLLPQAWRQGDVFAYTTIVNGKLVVAFCESPGDPLETYHKGKRIQQMLEGAP